MNKPSLLAEMVAAAIMVFAISYLIHHPSINPRIYSDIVAFWTQRPDLAAGKLPYIDYPFEYPPLAGFFTYSCAVLGGGLVGYYDCMSSIIFIFTLGVVFVIVKLAEGREDKVFYPYFLLAPSMILYLVYNFDIMLSFFIMLALLLHFKSKHLLAGVAIGLGVITKLMSFLLLPVLLRGIDNRSRLKMLLPALLIPLSVNGALAMINYEVWVRVFAHHIEWGLENSWLVNLFQDPNTWDTAKLFSLILAGYFLLRIYMLPDMDKTIHVLLVLQVWLLTTYVYTPQMNLWLLPFYALIGPGLPLFYAFELANAGIILTWFIADNPTSAFSPPQIMSTLRAVMLLLLTLHIAARANILGRRATLLINRVTGVAA